MNRIFSDIMIILSLEGRSACFTNSELGWELLEINSSEWTRAPVVRFLDDIKTHFDTIEAGTFQHRQIQYVFDEIALEQLPRVVKKLLDDACEQVQFLRWQNLIQVAQTKLGNGIDYEDREEIHAWLCPFIEQHFIEAVATKNSCLDVYSIESKSSSQTISEPISIEEPKRDDAVTDEMSQLQAQIQALSVLDVSQLVSFMPAVFENFFSQVAPQDLALLAGRLTIPRVSSPFTEPDASTLMALKRKFNHLPEVTQQQLLDFARELKETHNLKVRPNMRALIEGDG